MCREDLWESSEEVVFAMSSGRDGAEGGAGVSLATDGAAVTDAEASFLLFLKLNFLGGSKLFRTFCRFSESPLIACLCVRTGLPFSSMYHLAPILASNLRIYKWDVRTSLYARWSYAGRKLDASMTSCDRRSIPARHPSMASLRSRLAAGVSGREEI